MAERFESVRPDKGGSTARLTEVSRFAQEDESLGSLNF